jgi:hypothetical protein
MTRPARPYLAALETASMLIPTATPVLPVVVGLPANAGPHTVEAASRVGRELCEGAITQVA